MCRNLRWLSGWIYPPSCVVLRLGKAVVCCVNYLCGGEGGLLRRTSLEFGSHWHDYSAGNHKTYQNDSSEWQVYQVLANQEDGESFPSM